jgi:tape measure domain-containing protein
VADLTRTVAIIFQGEDRVTVATDGIVKSFKSVEANADDASKSAGELDKSLDGIGKQEPAIARAAGALKILAASLVVKDFIDANLAFEKFNKAMVAATGSTEAAAKEYAFISDVSNRLGIETRSAADAYAKFTGSVAGSSLEGEKARVIFEGFSGSLARMGATSEDISGAFVQLAQGISKGKFELEDLKSIAERFPGFFPKFAESLDLTTEELFDFISAGKITGTEILIFAQKLKDGLGTEPVEGFAASLARLRNALDQSYLILGESGAFDILIKGLQAGTAAGGLSALGLAAEGASAIGQIRYSLGDWLPYAALAAVIGLAGWIVWERVKQRRGGWA